MQKCRLLASSLAMFTAFWVSTVSAQLQPTTEFGITITPDQIMNAIQESQEFWPGVRKHIVSNEFNVADAKVRAEAVTFLKQVDNRLSGLLFNGNQQEAQDVLDYLSGRLRKFATYRELRIVIGDDALLCPLKDHWENGFRHIVALPEDKQADAIVGLLAEITARMTEAKIPADRQATATKHWEQLSGIMNRMHHSSVGKAMQGFETQLREGDPQRKLLLASIVRAADWAAITQPEKKGLKPSHFVSAWEVCLKYGKSQAKGPTKSPF